MHAGKAASITTAYREKFRTLFFSLKKNQDLCKRLLMGDLQPAQLVRMSKEEMDDPRNTKLRQEVLAKSKRKVVLDDEAAAKFSTAANKSMANKELQVWPRTSVRAVLIVCLNITEYGFVPLLPAMAPTYVC